MRICDEFSQRILNGFVHQELMIIGLGITQNMLRIEVRFLYIIIWDRGDMPYHYHSRSITSFLVCYIPIVRRSIVNNVCSIVDDFVKNLMNAAPGKDKLISSGYPQEFAEEIVSGYKCELKKDVKPGNEEDALLDLLARYDTSTLSICGITFDEKDTIWFDSMLESSVHKTVASLEVDPIVLYVPNGEILQIDHDDFKFTMCRWAISSIQFLDAILLLARYVSPHGPKRFDDPPWKPTAKEKKENKAAAREYALKCARAAGLDDSESKVYQTLLWPY